MVFSLVNIFTLIHGFISVIYISLILTNRSSLTRAYILIIVCIPIFGFLSALTAEAINHRYTSIRDPDPIETLSLSEEVYWKSIKKRDEAQNIVPLEEALIINDRQTRKKLILEMLLDDPMKNIDILLLARENNDVDTAHYANTTIAKIQRGFQLQVQKLSVEYESDPENINLLNEYIETLGSYIESGLSEAFLLNRQRIIFADLLDKKMRLEGSDKETLIRKIQNCLALKDVTSAVEANKILKQKFPDDEQTWISALQISVAGHDAIRLKETIDEINQIDINWSRTGKEKVGAWIQV